jgi:protein transport protein SEC24
LFNELKRNFQRTTAFDALMRVRTSSGMEIFNQSIEQVFRFFFQGIRPVDFLGNFYMTNATEMIFGTIDSDKSVSVELKHDDKLSEDSSTYTQVNDCFL